MAFETFWKFVLPFGDFAFATRTLFFDKV